MEFTVDKKDITKIKKIKKEIDALKFDLINSPHFSYFTSYFAITLKELIVRFYIEEMYKEDFNFHTVAKLNTYFNHNTFNKFSHESFSELIIYDLLRVTNKNLDKENIQNFLNYISLSFKDDYSHYFTSSSHFFEIKKQEMIENNIENQAFNEFSFKTLYFGEILTNKINKDFESNVSFKNSVIFIVENLNEINNKLKESLEIKNKYKSFIDHFNVSITSKEEARLIKNLHLINDSLYLTKITKNSNFNKELFFNVKRIFNNHLKSNFENWWKLRQKNIYDIIGRETIKHISYLKTSNINFSNHIDYKQNIENKMDDFNLFISENEKFFYPSYAKIGFKGKNQLQEFKNYLKTNSSTQITYQRGISKSGWKFLIQQNKNYLLRFIRNINSGIFCANNKLQDAWLRSPTLIKLIYTSEVYYLTEELIKNSIINHNGPIKYFNPFPESKRVVLFDKQTFSRIKKEFLTFIHDFAEKQTNTSAFNLNEVKAYFQILFYFINGEKNILKFKKEQKKLNSLFMKFKLTDVLYRNEEHKRILNEDRDETQHLLEEQKEHLYSKIFKNINIEANPVTFINSDIYFNVNEYSSKTIMNNISPYFKEVNQFITDCLNIQEEAYHGHIIKENDSLFRTYQIYYKRLFNLQLIDVNSAIDQINDYLKHLIKINKNLLNKKDIINYFKFNAKRIDVGRGYDYTEEQIENITENDINYVPYIHINDEGEEQHQSYNDYTLVYGKPNYSLSLYNSEFSLFVIGPSLIKNINRDIKSFDHLLLLSDRWHEEQQKINIEKEQLINFPNNFANFKSKKFDLKTDGDVIIFDSMEMRYINNSLKLFAEGKKMKHCVYGYKDECFHEQYLVFSIYKNKFFNRATLGINYNKDKPLGKRFTFSQVYSFANTSVPEAQKQKSIEFIDYLNKKDKENN